jgi:hypothetical protein
MDTIDVQIQRITDRIQEINREIEALHETRKVTHQTTWTIRPDQPPPSYTTKYRIPKNPPRILQLRAEKSALEKYLIELSRKKAESIVGGETLQSTKEVAGIQLNTKKAIEWCVRTFRDRKTKGIKFSQSGIAAEAVRNFFPSLPEFTGGVGKTGRQIKNREWLRLRDNIRNSYLPKTGKKRKPRKPLE